MPDLTCTLSVDDHKVWLEFDDAIYSAAVRDDPLVELLVKRLDRFVTHHAPGHTGYEVTDLKLLGAALFNILFGQTASLMPGKKGAAPKPQSVGVSLGEVLRDRLAKHQSAGGVFRIALEFNGKAEALGSFPWEFLYIGEPHRTGYFLSQKATLYRVVKPGGQPHFSPNLKAVVAWAVPPTLDHLTSTDKAVEKIRRAFQVTAGCQVEQWPKVTWEFFENKFNNAGPGSIDILHIIAHGRRDGPDVQLAFHLPEEKRLAEETELQKTNPHAVVQRPEWIMVSDLANLLNKRPPGLVFLHACSVGRVNPGVDAFRGAAELIAGAGVPVVIAMQYEIDNTDADVFTAEFYNIIATPGTTIDEGVRQGRLRLAETRPTWGHRRFATPIIFLSDPTAQVVSAPAAAPSLAPDGAGGSGDFAPCPFT
ncbi:MAG TPA: CHAT domain-containing protein, partial [Inquilinus sp.]